MKVKLIFVLILALLLSGVLTVAVFRTLADEEPVQEVASYYQQMQQWAQSEDPVWVYGVAHLSSDYRAPQTEIFPEACFHVISVSTQIDKETLRQFLLDLYNQIGYSFVYFLEETEQVSKFCIKEPSLDYSLIEKYGTGFKVEKVEEVKDPRREFVENVQLNLPANFTGEGDVTAVSYIPHDEKLEVLATNFKLIFLIDQFGRKDWIVTDVSSEKFDFPKPSGWSDQQTLTQLLASFNVDEDAETITATPFPAQRLGLSLLAGIVAFASLLGVSWWWRERLITTEADV